MTSLLRVGQTDGYSLLRPSRWRSDPSAWVFRMCLSLGCSSLHHTYSLHALSASGFFFPPRMDLRAENVCGFVAAGWAGVVSAPLLRCQLSGNELITKTTYTLESWQIHGTRLAGRPTGIFANFCWIWCTFMCAQFWVFVFVQRTVKKVSRALCLLDRWFGWVHAEVARESEWLVWTVALMATHQVHATANKSVTFYARLCVTWACTKLQKKNTRTHTSKTAWIYTIADILLSVLK